MFPGQDVAFTHGTHRAPLEPTIDALGMIHVLTPKGLDGFAVLDAGQTIKQNRDTSAYGYRLGWLNQTGIANGNAELIDICSGIEQSP